MRNSIRLRLNFETFTGGRFPLPFIKAVKSLCTQQQRGGHVQQIQAPCRQFRCVTITQYMRFTVKLGRGQGCFREYTINQSLLECFPYRVTLCCGAPLLVDAEIQRIAHFQTQKWCEQKRRLCRRGSHERRALIRVGNKQGHHEAGISVIHVV